MQGINLQDYRAIAGSVEDVFHPQARYFSISRQETTYDLVDLSEGFPQVKADELFVVGVRPRAFNLGVKNFGVAVEYAHRLRGFSGPDGADINAGAATKINNSIGDLETFLQRRSG